MRMLETICDIDIFEVATMPDGDKYHPKLGGNFQKVYALLCQGECSDDKLIRRHLKNYKDEPVQFIKKAAPIIQNIQDKLAQSKSVNWVEAHQQLDKLSSQTGGTKRGEGLAQKACEQQLSSIRNGSFSNTIEKDIVSNYLKNIYSGDFDGSVRLTTKHHMDAPRQKVNARLDSVRSRVEGDLEKFANQIIKKGSVRGLRYQIDQKSKPKIDSNTSLFKIAG